MTKHVFPFNAPYDYSRGIDTRDYIALIALQGLCANPASIATYEQAATMAYGYADALIEESKKKRSQNDRG